MIFCLEAGGVSECLSSDLVNSQSKDPRIALLRILDDGFGYLSKEKNPFDFNHLVFSPRKTNISLKNRWPEDVFPIEIVPF